MRPLFLVVALMVVVTAAACGNAPDPVGPRPSPTATLEARGTPANGVSVTDMAAREITVPARPVRFVALSHSAVEFLLALGLEPVGRPADVTLPEVASVPAVGSTLSPDFPAIAALDPDIVIADAAFHRARYRDFDQFPHPVFVIDVKSYEGVLDTLRALGEVTGREAEAARQVDQVEEAVAAAKDRASTTAPSVLIITGSGRDLYAGTAETYLGSLVELLGARNVLAEAPDGAPIPGFGLVELAEAAALNPDVVLVITTGSGGLADAIRTSPAWAATPAVRDGRVHELDTALFLRAPGPRVDEAVETLASILFGAR